MTGPLQASAQAQAAQRTVRRICVDQTHLPAAQALQVL